MSDSVISVENLSKSYLIGHQGPRERYSSLRDSLASGAKSMLRKTRDFAMGKQSLQGDSVEEFWALKDVSFEVTQGEVLGIIGRNGAGKSTLLKVLSRITEPTSGRVTLNGRVASLLEVGTGFHPELTGRENLYLNGAILGMSRKEITRKFDEIVDFAGVEKFLDTPVKRYSSGMYVRLAFAVAAHLEPEILIVDEVLAVGDAEFQKKCMGKMQDVAGGGRTVLFVSHNMPAVSTLCHRAVLLKSGEIEQVGNVAEIIGKYFSNSDFSNGLSWHGPVGNDQIQVLKARIITHEFGVLTTDQIIVIELTIQILTPIYNLILGWEIWNLKEHLLAYSLVDDSQLPPALTTKTGFYTLQMEIPANSFTNGNYCASLDLGIHNSKRLIPEKSVMLEFEVVNTKGIGRRYPSAWADTFRPSWTWTGFEKSF